MNARVGAALAPVDGSFALFEPPPSLVIELARSERVTRVVAIYARRRAARRCLKKLSGEPSAVKTTVMNALPGEAPFASETFDALLCAAGVPNVDQPVASLATVRRLVRAGGLLLVVSGIGEGVVGGMSAVLRRTFRRDTLPRALDLTAWMLMAGMRSIRQTALPRTVTPSVLTWARIRARPWETT